MWVIRFTFIELITGLSLIGIAYLILDTAQEFKDSPILPMYLAYGTWPFYLIGAVGFVLVAISIISARKRQMGHLK